MIDLAKEIDATSERFPEVSFAKLSRIAKHFYELGRKQVLQEIYNGKTKPVDKITAAWLND